MSSVDAMGWDSFDVGLADRWTAEGTAILGAMIQRRRISLGWSQRRLARYAGCDQSVISRLERGLIRGIRYRRFARIVAVLGGLDPDGPIPDWMVDRRPNPFVARLAAAPEVGAAAPEVGDSITT